MKISPFVMGMTDGFQGTPRDPKKFDSRIKQVAYNHGHSCGVRNAQRKLEHS